VAKIVKEFDKDIIIVVGEPHPTALPEKTVKEPFFDIAVRGEGEMTMLELIKAIEKGRDLKKVKGITYKSNGEIVNTIPRELIDNLDSLPFPARDLLVNRKNIPSRALGAIIGSRGCPFSCNYCVSHIIWERRVRFRSPKNIIEEIKQVHEIYKVRNFTFLDDTFTINRKWVMKICRLIKQNKLDINWGCNTWLDTIDRELLAEMKSTGCDMINVGLESGDEGILRAMNKNLTLEKIRDGIRKIKDLKFKLHVSAIIGYPGETVKSILNTENIIKETNPDTFYLYFATPYPGMQLYELAKKESLLLHEDWSEYTSLTPVLPLNTISSNTLMKYYYRLLTHQHNKWKEHYRKRVSDFSSTFKIIREGIKSPRAFLSDLREFIKMNIGV
jgi:radical SAM superfamily enzyme YgiQ (UPF0313 family)